MSDAALWTFDALVVAAGGRIIGTTAGEIAGISIDTRTIKPGEAFFAIKGDRVDGHDYVANAVAAGAAISVVAESKIKMMPKDAVLLVVPDVLESLYALARRARARSSAKIIAITGSVGKTGTKDALRLVLSREGKTHASAASHNNRWGVPLSLARLPVSARFGAFELGMNHAGELTPLSRLVRPHVALITTIEPVHIEYFANIEAIADAKAEIFSGIVEGGTAVLNRDNAQFDRLAVAARKAGVKNIVGFGAHQKAEARLIDVALKPDCSCVHASILGDDIAYKIGTPGRHLVQNTLGVLAAAKLVGADLALVALALARLQPTSGRGRFIKLDLSTGEVILIDESYNANPASMRAAIEVLGQTPVGPSGRRVAVLGDMLELGSNAAAMHRDLSKVIADAKVDLVFCVGPLMRALWDVLPAARRGGYADSRTRIEAELLAAIRPGDAIVIKGSNASGMGTIVTSLVDRYRTRESTEDATA
jgi:UDP-N-acetylmuramoyl-tripeptide--D-alanyl-D-alanine ligase